MNIFIGEFLGTLLLILLGNGSVATVLLNKSKGQKGGWIIIATGWGFAVAIGVYAVGWISGGHLNPAVTIGLIAAGKTPLAELPMYLAGQMAGAMFGAFLVWLAYYSHWAATRNPAFKLMCFCTKPAIYAPLWNFLTEVIATAVLLIGVLSIFDVHNGIGSGVGPYAVGILIFSIGLSLGGPTGYAINPARDLGPRIMHACLPIAGKGNSEWHYAWIPLIAPFVGGVIGAYAYRYLIAPL